MNCISCEILDQIKNQSENYALQTFNALSGGCAKAFAAFFTLWIAFMLFKIVLKGEFSPMDTVRRLLIYVFIMGFLMKHNLYWEYVYKPLEQTITQLIVTVVNTGAKINGTANSLNDMLVQIESVMTKILDFTSLMTEDASFLDKANIWVVGLILKIPFIFFWTIFAVYTLEFIMKNMVVSALSPLLLVAAGFDQTRSYFFAGIKVVLQGALTVCIAALMMGLLLSAIQSTINGIQLTGNMVSIWQAFSKLFFLGLVAVLFQLKSPAISSNIMGSSDGAGVSGAVASGLTGGFLYAGGKMAKVSGWLGGKSMSGIAKGSAYLGSKSLDAIQDAYKAIHQKFSGNPIGEGKDG